MGKNTNKGKQQGHNRGLFICLIITVILIAVAGGLYYAVSKEKPVDVLSGKRVFNLTDESKEALRQVDSVLLQKKDHWQLQEISREETQEKIAATGGQLLWIKRQLAIGVPVTTDLRGAAEWVASKLQGSKVSVVSQRQATYNGWDSYRLDLGIEVKAGAEKKKLVTDTIYFFHNGNLTNRDTDIRAPGAKEDSTHKKYHGRLAVIIDDCGGANLDPMRKLISTKLPFSFAIIPFKQNSSAALNLALSSGNPALLHLPMEPEDAGQMSEGRHTILTNMSDEKIQAMVQEALDSLPGVVGMNNHQGSKATSDRQVMGDVLQVCQKQNLFFVDSSTSSHSVALKTAREMGVPTGRNLHFLDNQANVEAIHEQMEAAAEMADRYGSAIVICHARPATASAWARYGQSLVDSGITLVPVTEVVQ